MNKLFLNHFCLSALCKTYLYFAQNSIHIAKGSFALLLPDQVPSFPSFLFKTTAMDQRPFCNNFPGEGFPV